MDNIEIEKLRKKITKDKEQSEFRISQVQKEIQNLISERRQRREEWEEYDRLTEGSIAELVNEITTIQSRQLTAQELLDYLEQNR